jgi:hypothetical protein
VIGFRDIEGRYPSSATAPPIFFCRAASARRNAEKLREMPCADLVFHATSLSAHHAKSDGDGDATYTGPGGATAPINISGIVSM